MGNQGEKIPGRELVQYGILALPIAFAGFPVYINAPDYYATNFGASLTTMALILLLLRFVDAFQDPFIGALSDRLQKYRLAIILISGAFLVAGFAALFHPATNDNLLLWFAIFVFIATTAYSTIVINLNAVGGLWSENIHERTRISVYRESFGIIGLLLAVTLPTALAIYMTPSHAFTALSLLLLVLFAATATAFAFWYNANKTKFDSGEKKDELGSFWRALRDLPSPTKMFLIVYCIAILASSIPAILILFFVRDLLNAEALTGLFLLLYFVSGAVGMPVWNILSQKLASKEQAWFAAMGLAVISFIWATTLGEGDIWSFAIICIFSGFAFGADLALPPSIMADHIHAFKLQNKASLYYSQLTLLSKVGLALSTAAVFPLLDLWGFIPAGNNSAEALFALTLCYALIPCLIKIVAMGLIWFNFKEITPYARISQ